MVAGNNTKMAIEGIVVSNARRLYDFSSSDVRPTGSGPKS